MNLALSGDLRLRSNLKTYAQAAQAAAWDAEIVRNAAEAAASAVAGNLSKGRRALIKSGPSAAVAMLTAAAHVATDEQEEAREEVAELVRRNGWHDDLGNADRGIYSTADFNAIAMDLGSLKLAAKMQLDRQQLSAANTLDNVLKELNVKAKVGTKSNDYIQAVELCKEHKVPVILPDRGIIFYYPKHGLDRN